MKSARRNVNEAFGCLLGSPEEEGIKPQLREVSKAAKVGVKKVRAFLDGKPAGLTFEEYRRLQEALKLSARGKEG